MNIKKPNQLKFYTLFNFSNNKYKIKFNGTLNENKKLNGKLSIYTLNSVVENVTESKSFEFKGDSNYTITKIINYINKKIKDITYRSKIQNYIKENLIIKGK